jgi:hypothetical protein
MVAAELLKRLFGKSLPTAAELAAKIADLQRLVAHQREMIDFNTAERKRLAAVFTPDEFRNVDKLIQDSRNLIEHFEAQIAELEPEHAKAVEREANAKFEADKAALATRSADLTRRLQTEFPEHAKALAGLLNDVRNFERAHDDLEKLGRELGRDDWGVTHPENFRRSAGYWSGAWPNPSGHGVIQGPAKDAPRGMFKWEGDTPIPAREGVRVSYRPAPPTPSLVHETRIPDHYSPPEVIRPLPSGRPYCM